MPLGKPKKESQSVKQEQNTNNNSRSTPSDRRGQKPKLEYLSEKLSTIVSLKKIVNSVAAKDVADIKKDIISMLDLSEVKYTKALYDHLKFITGESDSESDKQ